jgi:hypothetical protein
MPLLRIKKPNIIALKYARSGPIRYEDVDGAGYLEMPGYFVPQGRFFSRTLGEAGSGPMAKIAGTSRWCEFVPPFDRTGTTAAPAQLEVNLYLPGRGVVFLQSLKLTQTGASMAPGTARSQELDARIVKARAHVEELRKKFKDSHPVVQSQLEEIRQLEGVKRQLAEHPGEPEELLAARPLLEDARKRFRESHPRLRELEQEVKAFEEQYGIKTSSTPSSTPPSPSQ